jgi:hypothetical protein
VTVDWEAITAKKQKEKEDEAERAAQAAFGRMGRK